MVAIGTKRGYVGKYHRCSRLTETGALFPHSERQTFLGVCVNQGPQLVVLVDGRAEHVRMLLGRIESALRDRTDRRCFQKVRKGCKHGEIQVYKKLLVATCTCVYTCTYM